MEVVLCEKTLEMWVIVLSLKMHTLIFEKINKGNKPHQVWNSLRLYFICASLIAVNDFVICG